MRPWDVPEGHVCLLEPSRHPTRLYAGGVLLTRFSFWVEKADRTVTVGGLVRDSWYHTQVKVATVAIVLNHGMIASVYSGALRSAGTAIMVVLLTNVSIIVRVVIRARVPFFILTIIVNPTVE